MKPITPLPLLLAAALAGAGLCFGHDGTNHVHAPEKTPVVSLPFLVETVGPVKAPARETTPVRTSGQGYWKFAAVTNMAPIPEAAQPFVKGAHGTLIVDTRKDVLYWGLQKVGWIAYNYKLSQSQILKGDPAFVSGNLHGADIRQRFGKLPLVVVADNEEHEVYLSDTTFQKAEKLPWPQGGPYTDRNQFNPTDAAFTGNDEFYVTDGYGKAFFMPATVSPLKYTGEFIGGKELSGTPHGITYNQADKSLVVSARPEGLLKRMKAKDQKWLDTYGLPAGSVVCDVDIWDDYAIAPCLDGPNRTPGPIYIINLKKKAIVSTIRPKEDLGFTDAQHLHDATWYTYRNGLHRDVYIIFTNWNPGGIGALKLVNVPDAEGVGK